MLTLRADAIIKCGSTLRAAAAVGGHAAKYSVEQRR